MNESQELEWWLARFGRLGRFMHDTVIESLSSAHEEHTNAQDQVTAGHSRVYGPVNFTAQEFFHRSLKGRPEVAFERPRRGAQRLPIVGGRTVVFWRYANRDGVDVLTTKFGTSESRLATFNMTRTPYQEVMPLDHDGELKLSADDLAFVEKLGDAASLDEASVYPVTVVAYSSNVAGLYQVLCADAAINGDGTLELSDIQMISTDVRRNAEAFTAEKRFDRVVRKQFDLKSKAANGV